MASSAEGQSRPKKKGRKRWLTTGAALGGLLVGAAEAGLFGNDVRQAVRTVVRVLQAVPEPDAPSEPVKFVS